MLFTETDRPDVFMDDTGQMWPLGPREITQLRNSGSIVPRQQASGGGMITSVAQAGKQSALLPQDRGFPVASGPESQVTPITSLAQAGSASPLIGGKPLAPPLQGPVARDFEASPQQGAEWKFGTQKPAGWQTLPSESMISRTARPQPAAERNPQLQRVMPRERIGQQSTPNLNSQQPDFIRVGPTKGGWVDTARQTSGWSQEQQDEMRQRALDSDKLRQDALNQQYEATYRQAEADKFRAEADKGAAFNQMREEQQKLDTQNLYMEDKQKKIGAQLKAARERQVDPTKPFQGVGGGIAGVLAILGNSLGQWSAGINGGPNNALQLFNNMIERSVNEQLRLIEEEKDGALMSKADLDDFQFRNNEEKKALIRAREIEGKQAELDSVLADKALVAVHPMAAQMRADLADRLNQELSTLNSAISRTAGEKYRPPSAGGVAPNPAKKLELQAAQTNAGIYDANRKAAGLDNSRSNIAVGELEIRDPTTGAVIGKAPTGERAQKANERLSALEVSEWTLDRLEELRNSEGFWRNEDAKAQYESYAADLKDSSWAATRSDAPSEIESEEHKAKFGGLTLNQLRQGKQATQLKTFRQTLRQKAIPLLRQEGVSLEYLRRRTPDKDEGNAD